MNCLLQEMLLLAKEWLFSHLNRINLQGKLCETGSNAFSKEMLETEKCYMLDCDGEIFVWMGRQTLLTERRTTIRAVEVNTLLKFPFVS